MSFWIADFARSQSREEIARQYAVSRGVEVQRFVLALIPFAVGALFLPPEICLVLVVLNAALETLGLRLMRGLDPVANPGRYILMLVVFSLSQVAYTTLSALIWQNPDGFAKSFALGVFLVNMVHLATIRSVHLPLPVASLATTTLVAAIGNSYFWLTQGNATGHAIAIFCLGATVYFVYLTMVTGHGLYAGMHRDQSAAEAANAAKSRFLAQMSHELRTPLNAITGMGYAEMTAATSPASRERMETLVQSARSLSVLLNDILDTSAAEAGQLPIRPVTVNIRAETNATLALFRQQGHDAGMTMTVSYGDEVPEHLILDGQRYRQCLSNVMSNAIKYSKQGTIAITVEATDDARLQVTVADSGPGVPVHLRDHIFEPFQRGDSAAPGTGLGLSISRTLARRMGGDLMLLPSDTGAKFLLCLGLHPAASPSPAPAEVSLADLTGRRVMVVDDIATNRLVAMTYLRLMGATPSEAESGPMALAMIAADPPDVVLLDMFMPGMDGMATLQRLRALTGILDHLPVIAMTADATDERRQHYLAAGVDGYVAKPLSPEELGTTILSVLRPNND